jgi:ribonuclease HII
MPWIIGIDEAGYGPNLGPLVMTSVACRVPEDLAGADLWQVLRDAVRRPAEADDGRLLVEDSKVVYSTTRGLEALETGVLATLPPAPARPDLSLGRYLGWLAPTAAPELAAECWYRGRSPLPVAAEPAGCGSAAERFAEASGRGQVVWGPVRSVVVCPARFNGVLDRWGSKGAVLGEGLTELLRWNRAAVNGDEAMSFLIDKHGGRNTYAPMLQDALPDGMVLAQQESMARSAYTVLGTGRDIRLTFQPRADAEHFCVALASMVSKYVREVLMLEFNRFWQEHIPGLKPTAGYPGDAARFLEAIRPALGRLGLNESAVWRRK